MIEEAQQHLQHLRDRPFYGELVTEVAVVLQKRGNPRQGYKNPANRVQHIIENRLIAASDGSSDTL